MSNDKRISRRGFLESGGRLAAGALVAGAIPSRKGVRAASRQAAASAGQAAGANDRVNLGFIGVRGRGRDLYGYFGALPGVRIAALCDVDGNVLAERAADVEKQFGAKPAVYKDQRVLLENKDIDAVVIATPNHWHALVDDLGLPGRRSTSTSRSPAATISSKAGAWSTPRAATIVSSRSAARTGPAAASARPWPS